MRVIKGWIKPAWPAPPGVRALTTTRHGGVSVGAWSSCNLGMHCGDEPACVAQNRARLSRVTTCSREPFWLRQVHSRVVVRIGAESDAKSPEADAVITCLSGLPCTVLSADCLPILLCSRDGAEVAAIHAGWRGLARGIVAACLQAMRTPCPDLLAWLGPAIGPQAFVVGAEVREQLLAANPVHANAFRSSGGDRYLADIYRMAHNDLETAGVQVYGGGFCTVSEPERFFSYRRDGVTGRMASLIWIEKAS